MGSLFSFVSALPTLHAGAFPSALADLAGRAPATLAGACALLAAGLSAPSFRRTGLPPQSSSRL